MSFFVRLGEICVWVFKDMVYLVSCVIPGSRSIWVFGAWFGARYSDNSRSLFEYVNENCPNIRAVWLTGNNDVLKLVRDKGYEVCFANSLKGIWLSLRAGIGVICTGNNDINGFTTGRQRIINLEHGIPLKKIVYDDRISYKGHSNLKLFLLPFLRKKPRLVSATSLRVKNTVSGALRVPDSNVVITGYPRNDVFFAQKREKTPLEAGLLLRDRKDRRLGIYMPTHRREGRLDVLSLFFGEMDSINSRLREQRVILLVKVHYYHLEEMQKNPSEYSNIYFIQDKDVEQDIYSLLPAVDFLVTDYSSVYFDYLLLDRPIIFAPFDMEEYLRDDRELYYGYNDVTPGPKAGNWDEVLKYIGESLSFPERYARERDRVREMFHTYCDGHSSERVYKEILGILQAKPLGAARKR